MFWREPRLAGLLGLILIVIGMIVRASYPLAGETLWWAGLLIIMVAAITALRRKRRGG
jgi:high-affinity Fe2+/Pb2+ permease